MPDLFQSQVFAILNAQCWLAILSIYPPYLHAHPALDETALRNVQIGMYNISSARTTVTQLHLEISMSKGVFDAEVSAGVFRERTLPPVPHSYARLGRRDRSFRRSLVRHLSSFRACLFCRLPSSVQPQLFLFSDFHALSSELMGWRKAQRSTAFARRSTIFPGRRTILS